MAQGQPNQHPELPEWTSFIQEQALNDCKKIFEQREIEDFYNSWSEISKKSSSYANFGKNIMNFEQFYGKMEHVTDVGPVFPSRMAPGFYGTNVHIDGKEAEFTVYISYNKDHEVGEFVMGKRCVYHPPEYIKESRFERVVISENPRMIYVKPTKAGDKYPAVFVASAACHLDCEGRIGYSYLYRDYEYFPSANIALVRGEYTEEMLDTGDPVGAYSGKVMQFLLSQSNITNIFVIIPGYSMLLLPKLLRKFNGVIRGVICLNPAFYKTPEAPYDDIDVSKIPTDVPILMIQTGFNQFMPPKDQEQWNKVGPKFSNITMKYYKMMDYSLFPTDRMLPENEYGIREFHVSDVALRDIATWIRSFN